MTERIYEAIFAVKFPEFAVKFGRFDYNLGRPGVLAG
jgi:hypothetical protein